MQRLFAIQARAVAEAWEGARKLIQALADEKCRCFLARADAAEARVQALTEALNDFIKAQEQLESERPDFSDIALTNVKAAYKTLRAAAPPEGSPGA